MMEVLVFTLGTPAVVEVLVVQVVIIPQKVVLAYKILF